MAKKKQEAPAQGALERRAVTVSELVEKLQKLSDKHGNDTPVAVLYPYSDQPIGRDIARVSTTGRFIVLVVEMSPKYGPSDMREE